MKKLLFTLIVHMTTTLFAVDENNPDFIKVSTELKKLCGNINQKHILEIGPSSGVLAEILKNEGGFASYTILDLSNRSTINSDIVYVNKLDQLSRDAYDLVISLQGFSDLDTNSQKLFLETIIKDTPRGYLNMSSNSSFLNGHSITSDQVVALLYNKGYKGKVEKDYASANSVVITWQPVEQPISDLQDHSIPFLSPSNGFQEGNAITYSFSGGRFGDNLMAYLHAKWIAYKYGLPFLYIPFPFSDQLMLDDMNQKESPLFKFRQKPTISNENQIQTDPISTLYVVPYFPECYFEFEALNLAYLPYFQVDWEDPGFRAEVIKCLTPKEPVETVDLPQDCMTIGVHVRRGGGMDGPNILSTWPLKFPPDSYYTSQIARIAALFPDKKIYVHILTDDLNPKAIMQQFRKTLRNPNLRFGCRKENNNPKSNVLEDFYTIPKFDCLIVCQSNFSIVSSKMADYAILIAPVHAKLSGNKYVIDGVELIFNGSRSAELSGE